VIKARKPPTRYLIEYMKKGRKIRKVVHANLLKKYKPHVRSEESEKENSEKSKQEDLLSDEERLLRAEGKLRRKEDVQSKRGEGDKDEKRKINSEKGKEEEKNTENKKRRVEMRKEEKKGKERMDKEKKQWNSEVRYMAVEERHNQSGEMEYLLEKEGREMVGWLLGS
jgi:hypothetical protein